MTKSSGRSWPPLRFLDKWLIRDTILPTKRLFYLALAGVIFIAVAGLWNLGFTMFWLYNALLLVFSFIDVLLTPTRKDIRLQRDLPEKVDAREPFDVTIAVENRSNHPIAIEIKDDLPAEFEPSPSLTGIVRKGKKTLAYRSRTKERGDYQFHYLYARYSGIIGLWKKQAIVSAEANIRVYPNLRNVRGNLSSLQQHLVIDGQRVRRRTTAGTEFDHIREYVPDDDLRTINWAASARHREVMTNVFQPERGKVVTLFIDCGRMMGVELDNHVKLDRSLEVALTMAAVALKQGDQVAVLAFSAEIKTYVPAGKGLAHFQTILEAVYNLKSDYSESDYSLAFTTLTRYQKRRSFLVLFSDMENYLFEDQLLPYLHRLGKRHALLLLSLQDPLLFQWKKTEVNDTKTAYIRSVAYHMTLQRRQMLKKMASIGTEALDVPADQFSLTAVNAYLDLREKEA
ncbi:DUF58 domain-containing protein [Salicibibacter cibarius]|uniref:DUF58 domain-containing protein n=1 Tax=Salicibibacter cibarius TaxID=2743000 RepID=A0A7T7CD36_9BACI|nr:DUF58 domain-containing protein [Salicibibacter cibarius]QQK77584.1 DUF58 domain-containing protein [Salicibibacter cibarius]